MNEKVAHTAGVIWHALHGKGVVKLAALQRQTKVPATLLHMGLGWLAREYKLELTLTGRSIRVRLK